MKQYICVYDFETDSPNPHECQPVQLAAIMLHNITLEVLPNSEFNIDMRPIDIDDVDYFKNHKKTIEWHAGNYGVSPEEIVAKWKSSKDQKQAWELFLDYLKRYNKDQSRKGKFTAPIRAGANIRNFDNIIIDRLCKAYHNTDKNGEQNIFHPRDVIDIKEISFYWFENLQEPDSYNMDNLRRFYGIDTAGSHDALKDIRDEAWMIQKYLKLFRLVAPKVKFKGAYNVKNNH